jgi:NAD(P)-dependent dehydrogenase (short-subunit alcohol dehydrogenase family)
MGLATAVTFAKAGHNVYATMRNPSRAPQLGHRAAVEALPITIAPMDVDSDESVKVAIARVVNDAGATDVLVNNRALSAVARWRSLPWPSSGL